MVDGAVGRQKAASVSQGPLPPERRPPPGPPPASLSGAPLQTGPELQPAQDISPAVAAALLQLISQHDAEPRAHKEESQHSRNEDRDLAETVGALRSSDQQGAEVSLPASWTQLSDSPKSPCSQPSSDPPPPLSAAAQFPRDQDLRFSHGAPSDPGSTSYAGSEAWNQGAKGFQGNSQPQTQGQGAGRGKGTSY
ncbi:hypothetical protein MATL_G00213750 [Megalops atlanticus]|uniref:Uncharacterized protein n=1 Tax=Megalops atlanticus TaxID=7932 RepID=A0A9D3PGR4_MEGAT|nr:hypothetical protein MATL_G00213750 [Megalops atlanticus]